MSNPLNGWGIGLLVAVGATLGLYHAGINLGGALASLVQGVIHLFGTPLFW